MQEVFQKLSFIGRNKKAIKDLNIALEINPNNEKTYIYKGLVNLNSLKYLPNSNDFNEALSINPINKKAYIFRKSVIFLRIRLPWLNDRQLFLSCKFR